MILDATNICSDIQLLNILTIFKSIIKLATIIVPVILVIFVILDIIKTISSSEVDSKKLFKSVSKRIIAAVIIFLIPFMIEIVIGIIPSGKFYYRDCYDMAEKSEVKRLAEDKASESLEIFKESVNNYLKNKTDNNYNEANVNYEQARKDIKLVPKGSTKDNFNKTLKEYKDKLQAAKK